MTWRSAATMLAAWGLVVAAWTASHTHLHRPGPDASDAEAHHPILHSHLADHPHNHSPESPDQGDADHDETISIHLFVIHGVAIHVTSPPAALPGAVFADLRSTLWVALFSYQPPAHGPPPTHPFGSRAPPPSCPAVL